jgi:hypothetical protein
MGVFDWGYRQKALNFGARHAADRHRHQEGQTGAKPVKLSDGKGLYLLVSPAGSKLWRWKYRVLGKEKVMALGAYPDVSLAQAREGLDKARKVLAAGSDPMVVRKADKVASRAAAENSFESVARMWWAHWKPARSEQHAGQVMRRFEADVFPHIGARPVAEDPGPGTGRHAQGHRGTRVSMIWPSGRCRPPARCFATPSPMVWPSETRPPTSSPAMYWHRARSRTWPGSTARSCPS